MPVLEVEGEREGGRYRCPSHSSVRVTQLSKGRGTDTDDEQKGKMKQIIRALDAVMILNS